MLHTYTQCYEALALVSWQTLHVILCLSISPFEIDRYSPDSTMYHYFAVVVVPDWTILSVVKKRLIVQADLFFFLF